MEDASEEREISDDEQALQVEILLLLLSLKRRGILFPDKSSDTIKRSYNGRLEPR